jgi:hypothetical protein
MTIKQKKKKQPVFSAMYHQILKRHSPVLFYSNDQEADKLCSIGYGNKIAKHILCSALCVQALDKYSLCSALLNNSRQAQTGFKRKVHSLGKKILCLLFFSESG